MRHAGRAVAILTGFATGFIGSATAASAAVLHDPQLVGDQWRNAAPSTSAVGLSPSQLFVFVATAVLLAVAIVGLGHSLSHES
jgi:hypothetical protein